MLFYGSFVYFDCNHIFYIAVSSSEENGTDTSPSEEGDSDPELLGGDATDHPHTQAQHIQITTSSNTTKSVVLPLHDARH